MYTKPHAAAFLALGTVGLLGPLISGTGAVGTALQDIINSDGLEQLVSNFIGAPGTVIDGVVNGGYGPNLLPLLTDFIPPLLPLGPINPPTAALWHWSPAYSLRVSFLTRDSPITRCLRDSA